MNYRHAFHAGNFADVLKHAVLASVIDYMKRKDAPFRVIDTHAGRGLYDLAGDEAARTGEWREGIGRLLGSSEPSLGRAAEEFLAPYLGVVRAFNADGELHTYPGSPLIAQALIRPQDRLIANELHPEDNAELRRSLRRDPRTQVLGLDGWQALKSLLPPVERRGVVLVDPPFEQPGELDRLVKGLDDAVRRFATGTVMLWYPIKDPAAARRLEAALCDLDQPKLLIAELLLRAPVDLQRLNGCALAILNPPYVLPQMLEEALPPLARLLSQGAGARAGMRWCRPAA
jgi:23S rRNA (adenine2030-N6)-methyltransferase